MTSTAPAPMTGLAAAQIATLNGVIQTLANRPDVAPLIEYMFQNLSSPLGSLSAPHAAMNTLAEAFAENGALVEQGDTKAEYGVDVRFRGGCGALWFHAPAADQAAEVVTGIPDAPDDAPEDAAVEPAADDAAADAVDAPAVDLDATQAYEVNAS
jgi:hypothetical protein